MQSSDQHGMSARKLGDRLRIIRVEVFGTEGAPDIARQLGISPKTWTDYEEIGELAPTADLLRFIKLTGASPEWLWTGEGPKYSPSGVEDSGGTSRDRPL